MIILGIDPGSVVCGYGAISFDAGVLKLIEYGVIKARKIDESMPVRLREIFERLRTVIHRTQPEIAAVESIFYYRNAQSLVKLSQARAAAILAVAIENIPIEEYSPREVKKSVTGKGNAAKEQVQFMVKTILNISQTPEFFDVTDALAVAICQAYRHNLSSKHGGSWKEYLKAHPDIIVSR